MRRGWRLWDWGRVYVGVEVYGVGTGCVGRGGGVCRGWRCMGLGQGVWGEVEVCVGGGGVWGWGRVFGQRWRHAGRDGGVSAWERS